ncbi:unnamed protein product [Rotaria sp. Silwood2]|nr:unnamed protein product [Rotaria sp. Silwood2]CAF2716493.1 unnamed protein product [Rotaria sp. Silwood2]CAF4043564.1 unnamed protein product [Rotaria sp. Silwood2]CAF4392417.1 unnamed protein product [Rotaria sp. Silwood2]
MYLCVNSSKWISVNRFMDSSFDCPQNDDENIIQTNYTDLTQLLKSHVKYEISNKYIHRSYVYDGKCHCELFVSYWCEDEDFHRQYARKNISFQTICDGFTELFPITIEGQNQTDETECEHWSGNNIYTHCDDQHPCVSPDTNEIKCLPIKKANDGEIDFLGTTDEPRLCQEKYEGRFFKNFYCISGTSQ